MRYSQVLSSFYGIIFPEQCDADDCDLHFSAASIHWKLYLMCLGKGMSDFHYQRYAQHLACMKFVIVNFASFGSALDPNGSGMELPESWCPYRTTGKPDENMFDSMPLNGFSPGMNHPSDIYIFQIPPVHLAV